MQRQLDHPASDIGEPAVPVERAEQSAAARALAATPDLEADRRTTSSSTAVPHAVSSRARPDRSTLAISAGRCAGRLPCSIFDHSR